MHTHLRRSWPAPGGFAGVQVCRGPALFCSPDTLCPGGLVHKASLRQVTDLCVQDYGVAGGGCCGLADSFGVLKSLRRIVGKGKEAPESASFVNIAVCFD